MKPIDNLDSEELEILEAFESGAMQKSQTQDHDIRVAKIAAKNTVEAFEEIKIELPIKDISFLIHKYIDKVNVSLAVD